MHEVVDQFRELAEFVGEPEGDISVSRADLFVDFVYAPGIDSWTRDAWVGRAKDIGTYHNGSRLTGWTIGQGSQISARLYDKTEEIKKSGKEYLKTYWHESGHWKPSMRVYRLEFQLRGNALREFGCNRWSVLPGKLGELWRYLIEQWLRLTIPNPGDSTPTRWPTHPLWVSLGKQTWDASRPAHRMPKDETTGPSKEWLSRWHASALSAYMAVHRCSDVDEAAQALHAMAAEHYDSLSVMTEGRTFDEYVTGKAREKAKRYGHPFDESVEAAKKDQDEAVAREYRQRTKK